MDGWKMYWCISYWVSAYFPGDSLGIPIQDSVLMGTRVARSTFMLVIALVSRCFKKKTGKNGENGENGKNGGLVREIPLFQGNLGWWNIIIWPDDVGIS